MLPRLLVCLLCLASCATAGDLPMPENPLWQPIVDDVYLQEIPALFPTSQPLSAVAVHDRTVWVGDDEGVQRLQGEQLVRVPGPAGPVTGLLPVEGSLFCYGPQGLWELLNGVWNRRVSTAVVDVCVHDQQIVFASGRRLFVLTEQEPRPLCEDHRDHGTLQGVTSYSGTLYVHDGRRVGLLQGQRIVYRRISDWGNLQRGCRIRDLLGHGSRLLVATDEGLGVLRGMTWYQIQGEQGLSYEDTTCLAAGFDRDVWIGTARGAIRNTRDEFQYFGHTRWIPHDHVRAIDCGPQMTAIATDGGLSVIRYEPFTLAKKAAYYERWLDEWGMKRLGFIHTLFYEDGRWVREVSDNDVGYSSHYLHAKCFEFAVTGRASAREAAVDMMKSVKWSEEITSLEGFPARSIYAVGEETHKANHGSGGLPAEWHVTPDGLWEWKGDTSSDETDAQVYETSLFLELVANDEEKVWATDHLRRVVGHIVDHGFRLEDVDGKPTRWARWDPEYLQTPYGSYARGLNGLEAFNYVTTALHFTGDQKFAEAKQFHRRQGYLPDVLRQKLTFPAGYFTHFDDRLAFYSYFPLLRYEQDPELKSLWRRSLERSWEVKRSEAVPWFHFLYGAMTGNDCETDRAVAHLRSWPLDLRRHPYRNSHRDDLHLPEGYREYGRRPRVLNPREAEPNRWDGNFMQLDGGSATTVADPSGWLDAYWMGRYFGMITAPQTDDSDLTTVPRPGRQLGAKPYSGPPRPPLWHEQEKQGASPVRGNSD